MEYSKLTRINEYIGVSEKQLNDRGIYNGYVFLDSPLYLNPKLLHNTDIPELKNAEEIIVSHFETTINLLKKVKNISDNDIFWKMAKEHFSFPEPVGIGLGTSLNSIDGNGLTGITAEKCLITFRQILDKDIDDSYMYRLLYLVQENIGVDRISDMLCTIIYDKLLEYTQNKISEMRIECKTYTIYKGKKYNIFKRPDGKSLIFMPEKILTDIPDIANEYSIMEIIETNKDIREYVSKYFEQAHINITNIRSKNKKQMSNLILNNNKLIELLLENVRKRNINQYDFENDPLDIYKSNEKLYSLLNNKILYVDKKECLDLHSIIKGALGVYKKCIEELGLNEELYAINAKGKKIPKRELTSHRFFIIVLEAIKIYNKFEYFFESKVGNGQVEFVITNLEEKILVEFKLNKNNLIHGYNIQLEEYIKRYTATSSFFVIIEVENNNNVSTFLEEIKSFGKRKEVVIIDGLIHESPSKK